MVMGLRSVAAAGGHGDLTNGRNLFLRLSNLLMISEPDKLGNRIRKALGRKRLRARNRNRNTEHLSSVSQFRILQ